MYLHPKSHISVEEEADCTSFNKLVLHLKLLTATKLLFKKSKESIYKIYLPK